MPFQRDPIIEDEASPFDDDEEYQGPPGWLLTFGDFISLLLTFFVLLLSFSSFDGVSSQGALVSFNSTISLGEFETGTNLKRLDLSSEISYKNTEMDKLIEDGTKDGSLDLSEEEITENLQLENQSAIDFTVRELRKLLDEDTIEDGIQVEKNSDELGFSITIDQGLAFREGKASLKNSAYSYLKNISVLLREVPNDMIIIGYCNEALACPAENLEEQQFRLAILRADKIARYLIKVAHITPARISISGRGGAMEEKIVDPKEPPKAPSRVTITITGTFDGYLLTLKNSLFAQEDLK
jgi:chemotaxis protein MotB